MEVRSSSSDPSGKPPVKAVLVSIRDIEEEFRGD